MRSGVVLFLALAFPVHGASMQVRSHVEAPLEARIWLDRGVDPVLQRGDEARVYYRSSGEAYLLLFHISTDGVLRLLFPGGADNPTRAVADQDYQLLFPDAGAWTVDEAPGIGYFFVLASSEPLDFDRLRRLANSGGWNSSDSGNRIAMDPFVAVNEFKQTLIPGVGSDAYAMDFTAYHVGQPYSYPRFVCNQCHTPQSLEVVNPYQQTCPDVRVVIYNDPYYYPATRYEANQVVYPRPPQPGLPQFTFVARGIGEVGTPVVRSRVMARSVYPVGPVPSSDLPPQGPDDLLRNVDQAGQGGGGGFASPLTRGGGDAAAAGDAGVRFPDLPTVTDDTPDARPTLRRRGSDSSR